MSIENGIEQLILGLVASFEDATKENNAKQLEELKHRFVNNGELYDAEMAVAFDDFAMVAATPFLEVNEVADSKLKNIAYYIYGQQLPHFVRKVIENKEGWPCSGDKEYFVIRKLKKYIITGENQSLYDEYKGEQAYWSPKTFKDTDEVLTAFFKWYNID